MRKLLLFLVTTAAGVVALAWINFRRENEPPDRAPSNAGPDSNGSADPTRCAATTSGGKRCTREALEGSRFCWQHG